MPTQTTRPVRARLRRLRPHLLRLAAVLLVVFVAMQLVPYGWTHSNPPVVADAPWPDAESERIARQSCYSCHSNETDWPAYSYVAPMSWLVRKDVDDGRAELNFSEWDPEDNEAEDAVEVIREGEMPPGRYTMIHRSARLTAHEEDALVAALEQLAEPGDRPGSADTEVDDGSSGRGRGRGRGGDEDPRDGGDGD